MATKKNKNAVTKTEAKEAALVAASLEEDAGQGFENQTREDITMPTIWLLQALNPQVVDNNPEGSRPGLMMNSVTEELLDEFLFVPGTTTHEYVEKTGTGNDATFVGIHPINSDIVREARKEQSFGNLTLPNGHILIEHFSVFGVMVDEAEVLGFAVIRFKSTKIKVYKQFNTRMQTCLIPRADGNGRFNPAIFSHVIRVTTTKQSNEKGDFFNYQLQSAVDNNMLKSLIGSGDVRYQAAKEVKQLVGEDRVKADYSETEAPPNDAADDDTPF